jgi:hypothetical protein
VKPVTSNHHRLYARNWKTLLAGLIIATAIIVSTCSLYGPFAASPTTVYAAAPLSCDIYASYGTPCVTAHSTVRALFAAYNGPLYQIQRTSDKQYLDIGLLSAGGDANSAPQVSFCANTTCTITKLYDQTTNHNDMPISWGGYWKGPGANGADIGANAMALPITIAGHQVYGVKVTPGVGYRFDSAKGVATGSQPEGIYMMTSSNYVNGQCCFDYGSGETSHTDTGNATMNAIYWGTACWFGTWANNPCVGTGPWVEADLENGMYHTNTGSNKDSNNQGIHLPFVSAWLKNNGTSNFTLKYGNGTSGGLTTPYSGALPNGYSPMKLQPSIILGTGGDNSDADEGEFFEGAMTAGYPSDAAENAVQASLVTAGYGSSTTPPTPTRTPTPTATSTPTSTTTPTPTSTPVSGASCSVHYAITNQWQGGFGASLTITNTSSTAINGWNLKFSFPNGQTISQLWSGTMTQSGSAVTITNASYNGSIPAGGTLSSPPGFNGTWNGTNGAPTAFTLNGAACSVV